MKILEGVCTTVEDGEDEQSGDLREDESDEALWNGPCVSGDNGDEDPRELYRR